MNSEESSLRRVQSWETNDTLRNYREITMIPPKVARVQISTKDGELVSKTRNSHTCKICTYKIITF